MRKETNIWKAWAHRITGGRGIARDTYHWGWHTEHGVFRLASRDFLGVLGDAPEIDHPCIWQ